MQKQFVCFIFLKLLFSDFILTASQDNLFPFGIENGDIKTEKADDEIYGPIKIPTGFTFYGTNYNTIYVSSNGLISFDYAFSDFRMNQFNNINWTVVAVYWVDANTEIGGDIYYRSISDSAQLSTIATQIRSSYPYYGKFKPTWAFVVTWFEVAAYNSKDANINNTFQAVLTTDEVDSFVIFNFGRLMWSNSPTSVYDAISGFNSGDLVRYLVLPGSFTPSVLLLANTSNVNIPGKWIYDVNFRNKTETCTFESHLIISPSIVFFIGGDEVVISGICVEENDTIILEFVINLEIKKEVFCLFFNSTSSVCIIPYLDKIGKIPIKLKINDTYASEGFVISKDVPLNQEIQGLYYDNPVDFFGPMLISWNSTNNYDSSDLYSIVFIYVSEDNYEMGTFVLNHNATSSGTIIDLSLILPKALPKRFQRSILKNLDFTFIGIAKGSPFGDWILSTWLTIAPIYIYSLNNMNLDSLCNEWYKSELPLSADASPCWRIVPLDPLTGDFPYGFGDFIQDWSCNPGNPKLCNFFHPGAKVCYTSITQINGVRQQCCYSANNRLLVGPPNGGYLHVSRPDYKLEQFQYDVYPRLLCCKFSSNCKLYYKQRRSDNGKYWLAPVTAAVTGDPHFYRFNTEPYTFNGYGEYILLKIKDDIGFQIQARMVPYRDQNNLQTSGTVLKAIAIEFEPIGVVQIEIKKQNQNSTNNIYIILNGMQLDFQNQNSYFQQFDSFSISFDANSYFLQFSNKITVNIEISEGQDALSALIIVPVNLNYQGLLHGIQFSSSSFLLPNGSYISIDSNNDKEIFSKFGNYWRVDQNRSIFTYLDGTSYSDYVNKTYTPSFISNGIALKGNPIATAAIKLCGNNTRCLFDAIITNQLSISRMTLNTEERLVKLKEFIDEAVIACVPLSSMFENGDIISIPIANNGYIYRFNCNPRFCLMGEEEIYCVDGNYNDDIPICVPCSLAGSIYVSWPLILLCFLIFLFKTNFFKII